jgi:hypothetical protein
MTSTKNTTERRQGKDRRTGKDRRSSNLPEHIRLVERLEAIRKSLPEKERAVIETEERDADQDVRLKFEFECSEGLARDLIGGVVHLVKDKNRQKKLRDTSETPVEQNEERQVEKHSPVSLNEVGQDTALVHCTRPRKLFSTLFLILLTAATAIGGFEYIAYKKRRAKALAELRQVQKNQQLYEQYLASSLDILLSKLDQLTATPKMSRAFPEITSMSAIVRFKRGPEAVEKARAAREFIYRVKEIFDNWVERANDFSSEERPGKKEITYFLSVWEDTEAILNQIEAAKNDSSIAVKTIVQ